MVATEEPVQQAEVQVIEEIEEDYEPWVFQLDGIPSGDTPVSVDVGTPIARRPVCFIRISPRS